jgi:polynucleotide 5'-kinase involved in rRNA processing
MSKFSQIVSNLFKISLITFVAILAVASVITGLAYLNSGDYQIKSQVGKIYKIESTGFSGKIKVGGRIKVISADEKAVDVLLSASDTHLISYQDNTKLGLGIIDEDGFQIGRIMVDDFIRINQSSKVATAAKGLQFSTVLKTSSSDKKALC